jgi:hypothetical protein
VRTAEPKVAAGERSHSWIGLVGGLGFGARGMMLRWSLTDRPSIGFLHQVLTSPMRFRGFQGSSAHSRSEPSPG